MRLLRVIVTCFLISTTTVQLSAMRYSLMQYFLTPLTFNSECFDILTKNRRYQNLRDFFYSLPLEVKVQADLDALKWLKKKAFEDPALAYMTARVLKERNFPAVTWKLYVQLFLLYMNIAVARDASLFDSMTIKNHANKIRQHLETIGMLEMTQEELVLICSEIYKWKESVKNWSDLPDPSWILCFGISYSWPYESITYSPHYVHYTECFYQKNEDESNKDFVNALSQKAYEQWIKRYGLVKKEV